MSDEVIEINVRLTTEDYTDFSVAVNSDFLKKRNFFKSLITNFTFGLYGAGLAAMIIHGILLLTGKKTFPEALYDVFTTVFSPGLFFVLFVITSLLYFFPRLSFFKSCVRSTTKKRYASGRNLVPLAPASIRIDKNKLTSSSVYYHLEYLWSGFEKVTLTEGNLYIFVSPLSAFLIPSRFFKSEEEKQRIYAQCLKWWEAARENPVPAEGVA